MEPTFRIQIRGPLGRLVSGQALGQMADGLVQIAFAQLVLFEAGRGATPWELTKLLAVTLLPFSIAAPFAGIAIDRWNRRKVMVAASLSRGVLAFSGVAILILNSQELAYLAIMLLLSTSRFVLAAKSAGLPRFVDSEHLVSANAFSSVAGLVAAFAGAVAGAAFVSWMPSLGFVLAAGTYVIAAIFFAGLPPLGGGEEPETFTTGLRRVARELGDEAHAVLREPGIRRPLFAMWVHRLLLGGGFILLVLIADYRYNFEAPGYALALVVTGMAAFLGTVVAPLVARRYSLDKPVPVTFVVSATAAVLMGFAPYLAPLIAGLAIVAFSFQVLKVLVDTLVQQASPDFLRGRIFSAYDLLYNVAFVLAALMLVPFWQPGRERLLAWTLASGFVLSSVFLARRPAGGQRSVDFDEADRPGCIDDETGSPQVRSGTRWPWRVAALISGLVPVLAFPEPSLWFLGFFCLMPALLLILRSPSSREAGIRGWLAGFGYYAGLHHWLYPKMGLFLPAVMAVGGLLWIPWARLAWHLLSPPGGKPKPAAALVLLPSLWVVIEYVRSWEGIGGPWGVLGVTQWNNPPFLALASLGGMWLVSWVLVMVNTGIAIALTAGVSRKVRRLAVVAALSACIVGFGYGALRSDAPVTRTIAVGGVQPGVIDDSAPRFDAAVDATPQLVSASPQLIVWGESSVGFDPEEHPELTARIVEAAGAAGADILANVDSRRGEGGIYKTSFLVGSDGAMGRYDKMRLVPFGEYIPLRPLLGWVETVTPAAREDRLRGDALNVLESENVRIGPLVCFESAFPDMSRGLARLDAELVVVQSATTTFQESWAPGQHASLAAVRAVESGRPVVHATLSGVSAAFDARGYKLLWVPTEQQGTYVVAVPLSAEATPFVRYGDWVPALAIMLLLLALARSQLAGYRRPPAVVSEVGCLDRADH